MKDRLILGRNYHSVVNNVICFYLSSKELWFTPLLYYTSYSLWLPLLSVFVSLVLLPVTAVVVIAVFALFRCCCWVRKYCFQRGTDGILTSVPVLMSHPILRHHHTQSRTPSVGARNIEYRLRSYTNNSINTIYNSVKWVQYCGSDFARWIILAPWSTNIVIAASFNEVHEACRHVHPPIRLIQPPSMGVKTAVFD